MINKELNCKWHFGADTPGNAQGPNSSTSLTFKVEMYNSLIRESIQNSLDAVYDKSQPVKVSFAYRSFSKQEFPEFFTLKDHIQGCLDNYPVQGKDMFTAMLNFFNDNSSSELGYIRIIDSNTMGMPYEKTDSESPFNAFISEGVTANKEEGSGGAFGFGKAVFWNLSPISTIFVSSKSRQTEKFKEQINFVGKTKLCTHYLTPGELLLPNGIYSTDGSGEVITIEGAIPEYFRPKEYGTSVYVIGAPNINGEVEEQLIEAVLRNFWMAIYENKLIVEIEHKVIDQCSLSTYMESKFDTEHNYSKGNSEINPRPFFNIVQGAKGGEEESNKIEGFVEIDGKQCGVKLFIRKNSEAKGHFLFMRSPLMLVYSDIWSACRGADGVFICDDEDGNKFLRETEPSSHDNWKPKYYKARNPYKKSNVAQRALKAIQTFITEVVKNELKEGAQETEQVNGLEKVLTISTPKSADDDSKKDDIVDPETLIDVKRKPSQPRRNNTSSIRQPKNTKAKFNPKGRLLSNSGGKRKKTHIPGPVKPGSLKNKSKESEDGKEGIYAVPVNVSYRTWSQVDENNTIWHIIRIFSNEEIDNALIHVYAVNEEDKVIGLNIEEAPGYDVRVGEEFTDGSDFDDSDENSTGTVKQVKNAIGGVHINANIPKTIKVRFNSDIKYSLRINSDKIESNESK